MLTLLAVCSLFAQENNIPKDLPNPVKLTITGAGTGDRGCYISGLELGGEKAWELMGEHGCEYQLVVGKSYELGWREGNVYAAACEGNMDCPLSDIEPIVMSITAIPVQPVVPVSPAAAPEPAEAAPVPDSSLVPAENDGEKLFTEECP